MDQAIVFGVAVTLLTFRVSLGLYAGLALYAEHTASGWHIEVGPLEIAVERLT